MWFEIYCLRKLFQMFLQHPVCNLLGTLLNWLHSDSGFWVMTNGIDMIT